MCNLVVLFFGLIFRIFLNLVLVSVKVFLIELFVKFLFLDGFK